MFEASAKLEISGTEATADVIHSRHPEEVDGASGQHGLNHRQHCGSEKSAFLGTQKTAQSIRIHQGPSFADRYVATIQRSQTIRTIPKKDANLFQDFTCGPEHQVLPTKTASNSGA